MKHIRTFLLLLVMFSLACQMPISAAQQDQTPIPVTTEAAGQFEEQLATAAAELEQTGQVTVIFSESQLTSFFAQQLPTSGDVILTDPQVILREGKIEVTGKASVGSISTDAMVILQPYIDQGNIRFTIDEGKFGSIPMPDVTLNFLSETINQNMDYFTTVNGRKFWLEAITIADGLTTLSGSLE